LERVAVVGDRKPIVPPRTDLSCAVASADPAFLSLDPPIGFNPQRFKLFTRFSFASGAAQPSTDKLRFLGFLVDPVVGADKPREGR
jgi:hypothetical protein